MKTKLNKEELDQLASLAAMSDEEIDTQDIPEAPVENWKHARRPGFYRPLKKSVTMRLDTDVLAWFKDHAERGYQTEINRVLRLFMLQSEQRAEGEKGRIAKT